MVETVIHTGATSTRPLSAQFRAEFEVDDLQEWESAVVTAWIDDGAIVYLNGVEVGRGNLPSGAISQGTYATAAPRTSAASAAPASFTLPSSRLVEGTNVVAIQTHLNYRATFDVSMETTVELAAAE